MQRKSASVFALASAVRAVRVAAQSARIARRRAFEAQGSSVAG